MKILGSSVAVLCAAGVGACGSITRGTTEKMAFLPSLRGRR